MRVFGPCMHAYEKQQPQSNDQLFKDKPFEFDS